MVRRAWAFTAISVVGLTASTAAAGRLTTSDRAPEYEIKAAYLFNLANFTEWPADAFASPTAPFTICVATPDPFNGALARAFAGENIAGHPAEIMQVDAATELARCALLFIGEDADPAGTLQRAVKGAVLTVGETPPFERRGGMITFIIESGKVRFNVNPRAAERAGLRLSSKVLQVAAHQVKWP